jgi:hypothetical protein
VRLDSVGPSPRKRFLRQELNWVCRSSDLVGVPSARSPRGFCLVPAALAAIRPYQCGLKSHNRHVEVVRGGCGVVHNTYLTGARRFAL